MVSFNTETQEKKCFLFLWTLRYPTFFSWLYFLTVTPLKPSASVNVFDAEGGCHLLQANSREMHMDDNTAVGPISSQRQIVQLQMVVSGVVTSHLLTVSRRDWHEANRQQIRHVT